MAYTNAKIYFDGSHYIAIPKEHFSRVQKPSEQQYEPHKAEFNKAYSESKSLPKKERKEFITNSLKDIFENEWQAEEYVQKQLNRVATNRIKRKVRLMRKVNLQEWTHFCTFTYNDKIHTEDSFKEKLRNTLKHLVSRRGWKYIGAWERSPDKQRLHFHGIFYIPSMIGTLQEVTDYSTKTHRGQITQQNTHFLKHFGRNDFKNICTLQDTMQSVRYLMKYIEKQEEKIVYGGKLPTYFISDIDDNDIICPIGVDDRKLLLADDFICWDEGCYVGVVSKETIDKLRKTN